MAAGVEVEMAEDSINHTRGTADQDQATKDRKTNFINKFKLCTNIYTCNFSPYRAQNKHTREMVAQRDITVPLHVGRIKGFIEKWSLINQDPWVLQVVQGFQLPLEDLPTQTITPPELKFPVDQTKPITTEVQELLSKGAISWVQGYAGGFIFQIFIVPKKDGGYCPVINLRALNNYILEENFKMEGFHMVK